MRDMDNITPDAKAQAEDINFCSFLNFTNIGISPNIVEKPAMAVKINGYIMLSPINYMNIGWIIYFFIINITHVDYI